jgi:TrmH RNA methyltransferase
MRKPNRPSDSSSDRESPWSRARVPAARDERVARPRSESERAARPRNEFAHAPRARSDNERAAAYIERSARSAPKAHEGDAAPREIRLYGLNACLAAFAKRPDALRKVYLTEARIPTLKPVLAWCVKHRLGYRVVEEADLDKLTSSRHHEGVCFEMLRAAPLGVAELVATQPKPPDASLLLWLDGVGNPHNLGALLRSAAHFGVAGVVVPPESSLDVSGAAARVAEGAAEIVPLARADAAARDVLRANGYVLAATVPRNGEPLYDAVLPPRLALAFGAEGEGMSGTLIESADLRITIPGTGTIESLNVAASVAVVLGEYWRQRRAHAPRP